MDQQVELHVGVHGLASSMAMELCDRTAKEAWLARQREVWATSLQRRHSRDQVVQSDYRCPLEPTEDMVAAQRKKEWIRQRKLEHDERLRHRQVGEHCSHPAPIVTASLLSTPSICNASPSESTRLIELRKSESPIGTLLQTCSSDAQGEKQGKFSAGDGANSTQLCRFTDRQNRGQPKHQPDVYLGDYYGPRVPVPAIANDPVPFGVSHTLAHAGCSVAELLSSRLRVRPVHAGDCNLGSSTMCSIPKRSQSHSNWYRRGRPVAPNEFESPVKSSTSLCRADGDDVADNAGSPCPPQLLATRSLQTPSLARSIPNNMVCSKSSEVIRVDDITFLKRR